MAHQWHVIAFCVCCLIVTVTSQPDLRPLRCSIGLEDILYPENLYRAYLSQYTPYKKRLDIGCCTRPASRSKCCLAYDATTNKQICKCAPSESCGKTATSPVAVCATGWQPYITDNINICVQTQPGSFDTGNAVCRAIGGKLLEIKNAGLQTFVQSKLPATVTTVWLGMKRPASQANIIYASAPTTLVTYNNFGIGQPGVPTTTEQCVSMNRPSFQWQVGPCNLMKTYVCQTPV